MNPKKEPLPLFCGKCEFSRQSLLGGRLYCRQTCKYNPVTRLSASNSFFKRKKVLLRA